MTQTMTSPTGKALRSVGKHHTTPASDATLKLVKIKFDPAKRLEENRKYLADLNVKAFIGAIATAEGGGYDFKFGAVKGKKKDPWRFSDFSTHPGAGFGGKTTAAGMYQITVATWKEMGAKMGLVDFSPETQDLLAVEILRTIGVLDDIAKGDLSPALSAASKRWAALPQGPGQDGRYPQPFISYEDFVKAYTAGAGNLK